MDGFRLALSWLTVLPVHVSEVDTRSAGRAISWAPVVGALLGCVAAALLWAIHSFGAPPLLAGLVTVAALVLTTRGMHIDGLADTVDGLGCYGSPQRALEVMRDGSTGPFAVVALIFAVSGQAVALGALAVGGHWLAVILGVAVGRAGFVLSCRARIPAARPEGLGSLVAGSQALALVAVWWTTLAVLGVFVIDSAWWLGPVAVVLAGATVFALGVHTRRRFGGITGDVLGASCEIATTLALAVLALA
ncbi:adenosylcobinamide-GDP ribazoletransferase [Allosaccharopolyspora coralli]|uniref:Adenosylcobinamide-GDP ribazoletransferase n=1 Tax=Allosaccharopolyspora coralli TaxID=2665642 RepID=A0A5Q3Q7I0_9PSEU|nr:adenosylcobinamide-GDP ribazoletransferase [Allosaccharopolyspora coralli]QGK69396.1 adenosylcobinamide-GDP ribazoletransferase [Allosaccharopolyspora coralli]